MLESENFAVVWPRGNKPLSSDLGFLTQISLETPLCVGWGEGGMRPAPYFELIKLSPFSNSSYYLYYFIFQKRIEDGTSQLSTFFLVCSRHPGIYFTKTSKLHNFPVG